LHLLVAAVEEDIPFTLDDIDRLSRQVPHLCKVASAIPQYHMENVHRAGGVIGILAEINRAGLLHTDSLHVLGKTIGEVIDSVI
jgi:dihydroxy-acid dehydratase